MLILGLIDLKWLRKSDSSSVGSERPDRAVANLHPDFVAQQPLTC